MHPRQYILLTLFLLLALPLKTNAQVSAETTPFDIQKLGDNFTAEAKEIGEIQTYLRIKNYAEAEKRLDTLSSPAAKLLKARFFRLNGDPVSAQKALRELSKHGHIKSLVQLEAGLVALATKEYAQAATILLPLLKENVFVRANAALPLAEALRHSSPKNFLQNLKKIKNALPGNNPEAQSLFLHFRQEALEQLGKTKEAKKIALRRYIEQPVSKYTPQTPPRPLSVKERLARGENFLSAHRNPKVIETLQDIPTQMQVQKRCRWYFALGMAHRKLHHYSQAQEHLQEAMRTCRDKDLIRRASYVHAKVISIRSGLKAIEPIEEFAKNFKGHTMVDDVLFWAGDLYQRRELYTDANRYFERAQNLKKKGDYCAESLWRMAWIAFRKKNFSEVEQNLKKVFQQKECVKDKFHHSRANYWLGRLAQIQKHRKKALSYWQKVVEESPLGFYAQLSLARIQDYAPKRYRSIQKKLLAPQGGTLPKLCPGELARKPAFKQALSWLKLGLKEEAATLFKSIKFSKQNIIAGTHAAVLGVEAKERLSSRWDLKDACHPMAPKLLHTLLLDKAGAHHLAHWQLRTEFAFIFSSFPTNKTIALWRAAYPLAYREFIGPAEKENGLPPFLLQAIAREESAFDAQVVSWAGAYGLTQLILPTARSTLKLMNTQRKLKSPEELLDVEFNTSLGGALLGSLMRRFEKQSALAIAAYNAGEKVTDVWWKRHAEQGFDRMSEEITIRETRQYVKRVLRTYGIYHWLYDNEPPLLKMRLKLKKR